MKRRTKTQTKPANLRWLEGADLQGVTGGTDEGECADFSTISTIVVYRKRA